MTTLNDKNKEGGASFSVPPAVTDKRKMEIRPTEMVRARCFAVRVFCCFGDGTEGNLQPFHPMWWNNNILFPHAGEHYPPTLPSTMGQVRRVFGNTSTATSAAATGLLDDTAYSVLPVALRQILAWKTGFLLFTNESTQNKVSAPPAYHNKNGQNWTGCAQQEIDESR